MTTFSYSEAAEYVRWVVDDSGNGRPLGDDPHAVVRNLHPELAHWKYPSRLVGWITGGGNPYFVAVHSYLDVRLDDQEAIDLAADFLNERGIISHGRDPDVVL